MADQTPVTKMSDSDVQFELENIRRENGILYADAVSKGVQFDTVSVLLVRFEALLDSIFDESTRDKFNLQFERRMNEELHALQTEIAKAKLLQAEQGEGDSKLIVPGQ